MHACFSMLCSAFGLIFLLKFGDMLIWCSKTTLWHQTPGEDISRQLWLIHLLFNMENSHYRHCHHPPYHRRNIHHHCTLSVMGHCAAESGRK